MQVSQGRRAALVAVYASLERPQFKMLPAWAQRWQLNAALLAAMSNSNAEACLAVTKALLESGASAAAASHASGRLPLQEFLRACDSKDWSRGGVAAVVQALLEAGASATAADGQAGSTPLEVAVTLRSGAAAQLRAAPSRCWLRQGQTCARSAPTARSARCCTMRRRAAKVQAAWRLPLSCCWLPAATR